MKTDRVCFIKRSAEAGVCHRKKQVGGARAMMTETGKMRPRRGTFSRCSNSDISLSLSRSSQPFDSRLLLYLSLLACFRALLLRFINSTITPYAPTSSSTLLDVTQSTPHFELKPRATWHPPLLIVATLPSTFRPQNVFRPTCQQEDENQTCSQIRRPSTARTGPQRRQREREEQLLAETWRTSRRAAETAGAGLYEPAGEG